MPSKRFSEEELRRLLKNHVETLGKILGSQELSTIPSMACIQIGSIVSSARLLFGREVVDKWINTNQKVTDARVTGLCAQCDMTPAQPGESLCAECEDENAREEEAGLRF